GGIASPRDRPARRWLCHRPPVVEDPNVRRAAHRGLSERLSASAAPLLPRRSPALRAFPSLARRCCRNRGLGYALDQSLEGGPHRKGLLAVGAEGALAVNDRRRQASN